MNFGHPFISPPLCCYYLYPTAPYWPYPVPYPQNNSTEIYSAASTIVQSGQSDPTKLVLSREDLMEEGYERTKRSWTEEEDKQLLKLCANPNILFQEVAKHLCDRNAKMCYSRYRRLTNQSKQMWKKAENSKLASLVEDQGERWRDFVPLFPGRNHKQLKDHYDNFLNPRLSSRQWTVEEDMQLIELLNQHGQKWKSIQTVMPDRSCSQLKNRFFGRLRRLNEKRLCSSSVEPFASASV